MVKKRTTKAAVQPIQPNSVWFNVFTFSFLMALGGALCLQGDTLLGASSFAFATVFSSSSISWKKLPTAAKVLIAGSTIFGTASLFVAIFF